MKDKSEDILLNPLNSLRYCVFCGEPPIDKNKEHILADWVLRLTGDPNRKLNICWDWKTNTVRKFAASQMTAPSCEKCNTQYSVLESRARTIFLKIDARQNISTEEGILILDWLDKVRIGVWLFYTMLNKNPFNINPKFRIDQRVSSKDRFVIIYPYNGGHQGFNLIGTESPIFYSMPSCFGLRINGTLFINCSSDFLISRKMGFPFPKTVEFLKSGALNVSDFAITKFQQNYLPLSVAKYSMGFGQVCHSKDIYLQNQEFYVRSGNGFVFDGNGVKSNLIKFDQHGQDICSADQNESCIYGEIKDSEAIPFWRINAQIFDIQEQLFVNSKFSGSKEKTAFLEIHKIAKKMYIDPWKKGKVKPTSPPR